MKTDYIELKAGDVRQEGDEVTQNPGFTSKCGNGKEGEWVPTQMVGFPILPIDLHANSFRRPA